MTLTVPRSNASGGRAARIQVETPQTGALVAGFGEQMRQVGEALENDYLARERQRYTTDLTADMNDLRLEVSQIGDPDAAEFAWQRGVGSLRQTYEAGQHDDGRPRVSPKNREQFGLTFDELANRNAFSLGRQTLVARQAQRQATFITYAHEATRQGASADPDTRAVLLDNGFEQIDGLVAAGIIDEAEAARRKIGLTNDMDRARAIRLIDEDPEGFLNAADAGDFDGLPADSLEQYRTRAKGTLAQAQKAAAAEAERNEKLRADEVADQLDEMTDIFLAGRTAVNEDLLSDPEYQASEAFQEAAAARSLRDEGVLLRGLPPQDLQALIDDERNRPIAHKFQAKRLELLQSTLDAHEEGYASDPVAYAAAQGLSVPSPDGLDFSSPDALSRGLQQRVVWSNRQRLDGYTDEIRYLSNAEREQLKGVTRDADPAQQAAFARSLSVALSGANPAVVESYDLNPVFTMMGELQLAGGTPELAEEVLRGNQSIQSKNVILPPAADRISAAHSSIGTLFADLPGGQAAQANVRAAADALYAARVQADGPVDDIDDSVYRQAVHEVLGGQGAFNGRDARGGVQDIRGRDTVLPMGLTARHIEDGLDRLGNVQGSFDPFRAGLDDASAAALAERQAATLKSQLSDISGGQAAVIGGAPLSVLDLNELQIKAIGDDRFVFVLPLQGRLHEVRNDDGAQFTFSLRKLIQVTRP